MEFTKFISRDKFINVSSCKMFFLDSIRFIKSMISKVHKSIDLLLREQDLTPTLLLIETDIPMSSNLKSMIKPSLL